LGNRLDDERDESLEIDTGEFAFLDPRNGGDLVRARKVFEHLAAHTVELDALAVARSSATAGRRADVLFRDPPLRTGARDAPEVNPELGRNLPDERGRAHLLSL